MSNDDIWQDNRLATWIKSQAEWVGWGRDLGLGWEPKKDDDEWRNTQQQQRGIRKTEECDNGDGSGKGTM